MNIDTLNHHFKVTTFALDGIYFQYQNASAKNFTGSFAQCENLVEKQIEVILTEFESLEQDNFIELKNDLNSVFSSLLGVYKTFFQMSARNKNYHYLHMVRLEHNKQYAWFFLENTVQKYV